MYKENIEKVIACLLSKTDTKEEYRSKIQLNKTFQELCEGNISGVDYALTKMVDNIYKISLATEDIKIDIPQESMERLVESDIQKIVYDKNFNLQKQIQEDGLGYDLSIPKDVEETINYYYTNILDSIDVIYNSDVTITQARVEMGSLRDKMVNDLQHKSISEQSKLFNSKGSEASINSALKYLSKIEKLKSINVTGENTYTERITFENYNVSREFDAAHEGEEKALYTMGIKPYDEAFEFTNRDIVLLVAEINIGKTRFIIWQAYRCMMAGINCTIICTESTLESIKSKLELCHLYTMFGYRELTQKKINYIRSLPEDERGDLQTILDNVELCKADLYNTSKHGRVTIRNTCSYENCLNDFLYEKNTNGSEVIFIDHTRDLTHDKETPDGRKLTTEKESLAYLSECMKIARKNHGIMFFVASHPKSDLSNKMTNSNIGMSTNLAAGASDISQSATRIFYLSQTIDECANDFVRICEAKTREEQKQTKSYLLMRTGSSNHHIYDETMQTSGNEDYVDYEDLTGED